MSWAVESEFWLGSPCGVSKNVFCMPRRLAVRFIWCRKWRTGKLSLNWLLDFGGFSVFSRRILPKKSASARAASLPEGSSRP